MGSSYFKLHWRNRRTESALVTTLVTWSHQVSPESMHGNTKIIGRGHFFIDRSVQVICKFNIWVFIWDLEMHGLNCSSQVSDQLNRWLMSFCKCMKWFMELIFEYSKISSVYNLILHCTEARISFTKRKNSRGASTVPWGTPEVTRELALMLYSK